MNEHEPRPAQEPDGVDWRRLDVALTRFLDRILAGIDIARVEQREIDHDTARMIAHVLGRGYGRESHLAGFGREGVGVYEELRDEYLTLYNAADATPEIKELVNWLGTYLVQRESTGTDRQYMNEHLPPRLEQLLVETGITVDDQPYVVHLPASLNSNEINALASDLSNLQLGKDEALQAFLSLPDVDANTPMLMESFEETFVRSFVSMKDAIRGLSEIDEWETEVNDFAAERGLLIDQYSVDYGQLRDRLSEIYDFVPWKGRVHVFNR